MRTLGGVVAEARRAKGLSQKALAGRITMSDGRKGMSTAYLNDIEHDRRTPSSFHLIKALAKELSLDEDYLQVLSSGQLPEDVAQTAARVDQDTYRDALRIFRRALSGVEDR